MKMIMTQLVLRNKTHELELRGIGIFFVIASVVYALSTDWKSLMNFLMHVLYFFMGIGYFTLYFGMLINRITQQDNILIIRWYSNILKKRVPMDDIIEITGDDNYVRIILKSGLPLIFPITMLEPEEIRSVYKFLKEVIVK